MNLTEKELRWLKNDGKAVVGVTKDYLPFDYFQDGKYKGISGEIINEISKKTGIKFMYKYGDFDVLNEDLKREDIDILNIAKTDERLKYVVFTNPYSTERDIIIGRKDSKDVNDIFGLEGKKVAVIDGFWHYEYLKKNLTNVDIIETHNIQESLNLVHERKADYLIENPTVTSYYIGELQLYDLVKKGETSTDSYLYYGIAKEKPELASIINKVLPLLDIQELSRVGYDEVPHINSKEYYKKFVISTIALMVILVIIILCAIKLIRDLIRERTQSELLRQREHYLYIDALTELYNRNYFVRKIESTLDNRKFPQTIIIADMNNLKKINDKYGHLAGDELLKHFANILKKVSPEDSLIFRMGGDEFHILLENTDSDVANAIINNINIVIRNEACNIDGEFKAYAKAAFGHATRYSDKERFDRIVSCADKRMYEDKECQKIKT